MKKKEKSSNTLFFLKNKEKYGIIQAVKGERNMKNFKVYWPGIIAIALAVGMVS